MDEIIVCDITGRVIFQSIANKKESIIDLSSFNNGVYLVTVSANGAYSTSRVLKQ
jgi:hypothetical protein